MNYTPKLIIQVRKDPIEECNFIFEETFYTNGFVDHVGTVNDNNDKIEAFEEFKKYIKTFGADECIVDMITGKEFKLGEKFKRRYFFNRCNIFRRKVSNLSLDDFAGVNPGADDKILGLQQLFEKEFGIYINTENEEYMTLDRFLRQADEEATYYVGNLIEYD